MIDIEKLRSFYYVIKEGSLLKAAAVLEKNHTTLSKHLTIWKKPIMLNFLQDKESNCCLRIRERVFQVSSKYHSES